MSPKENQISPELQQQAVKIELPAGLFEQLDEVKKQAEALTWGNENWLDEQLWTFELVFPGNWETDEELVIRANLLRDVIGKNPQWWKQWNDKIKITWDGFDFPELKICVKIHDENNLITFDHWNIYYGLSFLEYKYLYDFIQSSWFSWKIRDFLWMKNESYWINDNKIASTYFFSFIDGIKHIRDEEQKCALRTKLDLIPF